MTAVELSPPAAKQAKLASACGIDKLADAELAAIFKHLPPIDRLLVSEVCKRWHAISKQEWLEITHLDLSPIPGPNIASIASLCPNLRNVSAVGKTFDLNELNILSCVSLSSVNLHACTCNNLPATDACRSDLLSAVFSNNLRHASWDELVLHDLRLHFNDGEGAKAVVEFPASLPPSLRRLQISGVSWSPPGYQRYGSAVRPLSCIGGLQALECLIFLSPRNDVLVWSVLCDFEFITSIESFGNLRELALGTHRPCRFVTTATLARSLCNLPRLETLFLHSFSYLRHRHFTSLVTKHPSLRILVLTGSVGRDVQFPARVRFGNGLNADPLPELHIFVGKIASEEILFPTFPSDAAKVYPISEPWPQFLDREDIKPIFEGVWIAAQIKEAAKQGSLLFDIEGDLANSFRSSDT